MATHLHAAPFTRGGDQPAHHRSRVKLRRGKRPPHRRPAVFRLASVICPHRGRLPRNIFTSLAPVLEPAVQTARRDVRAPGGRREWRNQAVGAEEAGPVGRVGGDVYGIRINLFCCVFVFTIGRLCKLAATRPLSSMQLSPPPGVPTAPLILLQKQAAVHRQVFTMVPSLVPPTNLTWPPTSIAAVTVTPSSVWVGPVPSLLSFIFSKSNSL